MRNSRSSRSRNPEPSTQRWWKAEEGEVHKVLFDYVANVERQQFDVFNRFVQLEMLYDPNNPNYPGVVDSTDATPGQVIENVIASNVDTVTAAIAATELRPRFMTDDGDWSTQQLAMRLEWYSEGVGKLLDIHVPCQKAFRDAAKKGTGIVKVYADQFDEIHVDHVRVDDIIVDEAECRHGGKPRQIHQRMTNVDREELKAQFPDYEDEIDAAQTGKHWGRMWAGYRPLVDNSLVAIESWKFPIGKNGRKGYVAGRHTITIDGCDLLDEEWHEPTSPHACMMWSERDGAWYGISLAERIAGMQRALNKMNWQEDRMIDQYAVPTTYVDMADAKLAVQTINRVGTVVVTKGQRPTTVMGPAVHPDMRARHVELKGASFEESGVSRMASQAVKPAGVDSAVAMRELRDQTTQRFSTQEKAYERFVLQVFMLVLGVCKDLGDERAPVINRKQKFGTKKLKWSDVDMGELRVQIAAASTLSRTPAGRYQTALEWAQAGVITTDEWRKLTKHPDLDHILSMYTQGMESVEADVEAIIEGHHVSPEPFGNLLLMTRVAQMAYLRCRDRGAPEELLESLRDYVVKAAYLLSQKDAANSNMPAMPDAAAASTPAAALSPQAMQLQAS